MGDEYIFAEGGVAVVDCLILEAWGPPAPSRVVFSYLHLYPVNLQSPYLREFKQGTVLSLGSLTLRGESLLEPEVWSVVDDVRTLSGLQY